MPFSVSLLWCFSSPFLPSLPLYFSMSVASKETTKRWAAMTSYHLIASWGQHLPWQPSCSRRTCLEYVRMGRGCRREESWGGGMLRQGICSFRDQPCYSESLVFPRNCGLELSKVPRVNSLEGDPPHVFVDKEMVLVMNNCQCSWDKWHSEEDWKENFIDKSYPDTDLFGFVWKRTWWNINIHSVNIY